MLTNDHHPSKQRRALTCHNVTFLNIRRPESIGDVSNMAFELIPRHHGLVLAASLRGTDKSCTCPFFNEDILCVIQSAALVELMGTSYWNSLINAVK